MKLYTVSELKKKYGGKFIDTYPHHFEVIDKKTGKYITVYEVRGVSQTIKENYNDPNVDII